MTQTLKNMLKKISLVAVALIVGVTVASAAGTWTPPPPGVTPPSGNVDAPVNVGSANQGKVGRLAIGTASIAELSGTLNGASNPVALNVVGSLKSTGASINGGLIVNDGNQGKGKILSNDPVSDPNGTLGAASWTSIVGSLISSATGIVYWSEYEKDGGGVYGGQTAYKCQSTSGVGTCSGLLYGGANSDGRLSRISVSCTDGSPLMTLLARSTSAPAFLGVEWWQKEYIGLCMSGAPSGFADTTHWSQ